MRRYLLLSLLVLGFLFGLYKYAEFLEEQYQADLLAVPDESRENSLVVFKVEPGQSFRTISQNLVEDGLIVSLGSFQKYVSDEKLERSLQAGDFTLHYALTIPEVVEVLTGKLELDQLRVTIQEGLTVNEIIAKLVELDLATEEEIRDCLERTCSFTDTYDFLPSKVNDEYHFPHSYLEGYLFPDTYFISRSQFELENFIGLMLATFRTRVVNGLADEIAASDYNLEELMIMASVIEKESRPRDNQAKVAGVLWKRIENGVQIAADATTRYIKDDPNGPLYATELASLNPYNTRRVRGLPPSPISNPGLASIKATISPESSSAWYYLHDLNGQIHFSVTEAEHNRKKALYLQ